MLNNIAGNLLVTRPHHSCHFLTRMSDGEYLVPYGNELPVRWRMPLRTTNDFTDILKEFWHNVSPFSASGCRGS